MKLEIRINNTQTKSYQKFDNEYNILVDTLRNSFREGSKLNKRNLPYDEFLKRHSFEFFFGRESWLEKIDGTIYENSPGKIFHKFLKNPTIREYGNAFEAFNRWISEMHPHYEKMPGVYITIRVKD